MSRPRYLADEDLRGSIVRAVRRSAPSLEITSVLDEALLSVSDEMVLDFAWRHRWLVISHDVNTLKATAEKRIAEERGLHGLFLVPQRSATRKVADSLVLIWEASEFEEWRDKIVYLPL
jgi:PIN like domain